MSFTLSLGLPHGAYRRCGPPTRLFVATTFLYLCSTAFTPRSVVLGKKREKISTHHALPPCCHSDLKICRFSSCKSGWKNHLKQKRKEQPATGPKIIPLGTMKHVKDWGIPGGLVGGGSEWSVWCTASSTALPSSIATIVNIVFYVCELSDARWSL